MATFSDKTGRAWTLAIDIGVMRRARSALAINLADCLVLGDAPAGDERLMLRLARDPVLLADLLYVLCEAQAHDRGLTDETFVALFDGPSIEAAAAALIEALNDFFRNPASRLVAKTTARVLAIRKDANLTDEELDMLIDRALDVSLASRPGSTSSPSRVSSASTRRRGRRGS